MTPMLLALALVAAAPAPDREAGALPGPRLTLDIDAAPLPNLTYQLDCMAGLLRCSTDAYRQLWKEKLAWSPEDDQALATWTALRKKYQGQVRLDRERKNPGLPVKGVGVDLETRQRFAGFVATDLASYRQLIGMLYLPADADRMAETLAHFHPRFDGWWQQAALPQLRPFLKATLALVRERDLVAFFDQAAAFYGADLPPGTHLPMHLIFRPLGKTKGTNGQQVDQHSVVEVLEGEKPEDRIDVVAHELFHFFHYQAPTAHTFALTQAFTRSSWPDAVAGFALLDEAVATALGNGLVARKVLPKERFEKDRARALSFYEDADIDACAKALMDPLAKLLETGKGIGSPEFFAAYQAAAEAAFGAGGAPPAVFLKSSACACDPQFGELRAFVRERVKSSGMWASIPLDSPHSIEDLQEFPLLASVAMVAPGDLQHLKGWEPVLGKGTLEKVQAEVSKAGPSASLVYGLHTTTHAWLWILVAPDLKAMTSLTGDFLAQRHPTEGVWRPAARP
jgi:hypothetical protein